jgi:transcription-repair coupling factor (superfamily II helicase)
MGNLLKSLCPDLSIGIAHGQMEGHHLEEALLKFIGQEYDVLCCTNIVESGVDIANANTIIINNAHQFGLSDLHQLRGRVGRSNKKAFCYLVSMPMSLLPTDSRKRLQTLEQFNELGSGFQIAMRDLDIRGAGNLLGGEQSGFIAEIGFEMYQKILAEAIRELKSTDFKTVFAEEMERKKDFVSDCSIDTDFEILIPDHYVENITERLSLYTQLDDLETDEEMKQFALELVDRFGAIPPQVEALFTTLKCRRIARELGFEKLIVKNELMRLYFIDDPESSYYESDTFKHIMGYIQTQTNRIRIKQSGKHFYLTTDRVKNMQIVVDLLEKIKKSLP